MNEIDGLNQLKSLEERWRDVKKKKRLNLDKMKKVKRAYVKAKIEKKRINREVKQLQKEWKERIAHNPSDAKSAFAQELRDVTTEDMFPKDLEKEFNKIELKNIKQGRTMKTEDLCEDIGLKHTGEHAVEVFERELMEDMKEHDDTPPTEDATDADEETKAQIAGNSIEVGLSDSDIIIDEAGNETEIDSPDEEK